MKKLLLVIFISVATTTLAVDRYFLSVGSQIWSDTAMWSDTSGGAGGFSVPGVTDRAIFDSNSGNCGITVTPISVGTLFATNGYASTVSASTSLTVSNLIWASGTFNGGTLTNIITTFATITGGTYTATSGKTQIKNFVITNCTFNANSGIWVLYSSSSMTWGNQTLNRLIFDGPMGGVEYWTGNVSVAENMIVSNWHQVSGAANSFIYLYGNFTNYDTFISSYGVGPLLEFSGTAIQFVHFDNTNFSVSHHSSLPWSINKTAGSVQQESNVGLATAFYYKQGDYNPNGFTFGFYGGSATFYLTNNFTLKSDFYVNAPGNVMVLPADKILTINGNFDVSANSMTGGDIILNGSICRFSTYYLGSGKSEKVVLSPTGSVMTVCGPTNPVWTVGYGPVLVPNTDKTIIFTNNLHLYGYTNANPAGTIRHNGQIGFVGCSYPVTTCGEYFNNIDFRFSSTITFGSIINVANTCLWTTVGYLNGGSLYLEGDAISSDSSVLGSTPIMFTGTKNQTISGSRFCGSTMTVNKPNGTVTMANAFNFNVSGQDFVVADGTLDLNGYNLTVNDRFQLDDTLRLKGNEFITSFTNALDTNTSTLVYHDAVVNAIMTNLNKRVLYNLTLGSGKTHSFATGLVNQVAIRGVFASNGGCYPNRSKLRSILDGTQWYLNLIGTSALYSKVDVKDSNAAAGLAVQATGSYDRGNNINWLGLVTDPTVLGLQGGTNINVHNGKIILTREP